MAQGSDRIWRSGALVCLAALLWACGASNPRPPSPSELEGMPEVTVSVDPRIEADRVLVFERQDGRTRLRNAVLTRLADTGKGRGLGADEIQVVVTRFRLRSTGSGVWWGAMAGADMLDVAVTLVRGGEVKRTYDAGAGGIAAGLVKPSANGRFNGLVEAVAERIVNEL